MGRSSSKQQGSIESSTNTKSSKKDQEPHLSGAYIRSLVKQLTSSKSSSSTTKNDISLMNATINQKFEETRNESSVPPPQQQHKKQVRRRLHTSRPYQERLLNMAEARREIVTALKFHRASMKQQQEQQQLIEKTEQQHQHPMYQPSSSRNNSSVSYTTIQNNKNDSNTNPYLSSASSWPICGNIDAFNLTLPNQTLGLNLNIHDLNNFDTSLYNNNHYYPFSTNILTVETSREFANSEQSNIPSVACPGGGSGGGDGFYHEMDDEEMAEIRSLGDQHEMEWKDKMNLVTSASWLKYLKSMDIGGDMSSGGEEQEEEEGYNSQFDQVMEFPSWLNNGSEGCFDQHFNDLSSDDYFQDPALPCMDIEEIEGMDGEWLS